MHELCCFDTMYACDKQTDRQTDRQTDTVTDTARQHTALYASHGKNGEATFSTQKILTTIYVIFSPTADLTVIVLHIVLWPNLDL